MPARRFIAAGSLALGAATLSAQTPTLVADLDKTPAPSQFMNPFGLETFKGAAYFSGFTHTTGAELFRSSGGQPTLVKDLNPGSLPGRPFFLTAAGNRLFFVARGVLWSTDGTTAGTQSIYSGLGSSNTFPHALHAVGNRLYFHVGDGRGPADLWTSDGTKAGTVLLRSGLIRPEAPMLAIGTTLYFVGYQAATGFELWRTNGTKASTILVKDVQSGATSSNPHTFGAIGNKLVFTAGHPSHAHWISDGTAAGTTLLIDVNGNATGGWGSNRVLLNNKLYFGAAETALGAGGLWVTSGTTATTSRIIKTTSIPRDLTLHGGRLYFTAETWLWESDGTAAGTKKLLALGGTLQTLQSSVTHLFVMVAQSSRGGMIYPLFSYNRTAGLQRLGTFRNAWQGAATAIPGLFLFSAYHTSSGGNELWRSDGTLTGTRVAFDYKSNSTHSSSADARVDLGAFAAGQANIGTFVSDGTPTGTRPLRRIGSRVLNATLDGSPYVTLGGLLERFDPVTLKATTIHRGGVIANYRLGREMFFVTTSGEVYRTDGTAAGTKLVKKVASFASSAGTHTIHGNAIYAIVDTPGGRLWRIDGTAAGTHEVPVHGSQFDVIYNVSTFGSHLMISGTRGLLRSDGTTAGTTKIADLVYNTTPVELGGKMYLLANAPTTKRGLWQTDGTASGTVLVKALQPGVRFNTWSEIVRHRGAMYFYATDTKHGSELWTSNGTAAGTKILKDVLVGPGGLERYLGRSLQSAGQFLYFVAKHKQYGVELWRTDGTSAGTTLVHDLHKGTSSSYPGGLYLRRGELWFTADDNVVGRELWRVDVGPVVQRVGYGCAAQGLPPQLAATPPKLGSNLTIDVTNIASSARAAVLAFGIAARREAYLGAGCSLHVDFTLPTIVQYLTPSSGKARLSLTVPTVSSLHGALVPLQAAAGPTTNAPLGVDLSHALFLAFRR